MLKTKRNLKPLLVAGDVYRPAAIDQLKILGDKIGVPVYAETDVKDAIGIATRGVAHAKANGMQVVIIDTAGRFAVDEEMMREIESIKRETQPDETLLLSMGWLQDKMRSIPPKLSTSDRTLTA